MGYPSQSEKVGLTFDELRRANLARLPRFKNSKGAPAHSEANGSDWTPAEWTVAVLGELGEFANKLKKYRRGDIGHAEFIDEARKELADVVCYTDLLAYRLGIDLGEATRGKFNEVSDRIDVPIYIGPEGPFEGRDGEAHGRPL